MNLFKSIRVMLVICLWLPAIAFGAITHVKVFVQQSVSGSSSTGTFTTSATNKNDAVCVQIAAAATILPTSATLTATGWTFTQFTPASGLTTWPTAAAAGAFCAIAPNASSVTFTATFTGGTTFTAISILGDEFTGNNPLGGTTTFNAAIDATALVGSPTVNITPVYNDCALWGAAQDNNSAVGSGFTKGADDTQGDWSEWKILSGQAGTPQTVSFTGGPGYIIHAVAITPYIPPNVILKGKTILKGKVIIK